jgi:U2-associated protein SR140
MWPRTAEERIRNRHTGFVCFMTRQDAEDAMMTCNETDPFNVGRKLMMRWGKNVKKIVKRGTGGIPIAPIEKQQKRKHQQTEHPAIKDNASAQCKETETIQLDQGGLKMSVSPPKFLVPSLTETNVYKTIRVQIPSNPQRAKFISTVASFVAKDGYQLERLILTKESVASACGPNDTSLSLSIVDNEFDFLLYPIGLGDPKDETYQRRVNEHQFYKWRVYSFCHGDTYHQWHQEPFVMFQPDGCIWVPPTIIDEEAAKREEFELQHKEEEIAKQRKQRQQNAQVSLYATGRQLEQQQRLKSKGRDGTIKEELSKSDRIVFDQLFVKELCASRTSICEAMAFCFGKSFAVSQITSLLQELLLAVDANDCSVDTMIARMFLISDILFNSQQPGVKNAFKFRDWIQKSSPFIFASIGTKYKPTLPGRLTQERLTVAFHTMLAAWANWGVFDPLFIDELDARYQGKEILYNLKASNDMSNDGEDSQQLGDQVLNEVDTIVVYDKPQSEWIAVEADDPDLEHDEFDVTDAFMKKDDNNTDNLQRKLGDCAKVDRANECQAGVVRMVDNDPECELVDDVDDPDGESLDEDDDPDGEPLDEDDDPDGEPLDEDDEG